MAFLKDLSLPSGFTASYIRLGRRAVDPDAREATAQFRIYKDAEAAARSAGRSPLEAVATDKVIKLRLVGEDFDRFFAKGRRNPAESDEAIFYRAARELPGCSWSDFDAPDPEHPERAKSVLSQAEDV